MAVSRQSGPRIMGWTEQVFNYCERGLDPSFWAEPINAVSNGAFLVAAALAAISLHRDAPEGRSASGGERVVLWLLIALVAVIGVGSFLFHTFATRWALIADVAPITVFMIAYVAYALRMLLQLGWFAIAAALVAFLYAGSAMSSLTCQGPPDAAGATSLAPCFNGSLGYAPALATLFLIGGILVRRGSPSGRKLLVAGGIFALSVLLRTIDRDVCNVTHAIGQPRGTHAFWHLLNAVTLYLLLSAAIDRRRQSD